MAKVVMGVGIPGSGKTTALKPFAEKNGYTYISPDEVRAEMTGNESDQSKNTEVWAEVYRRAAHALCEGQNVVVDATFANESQRRDFIGFAREHGAEKVQGVFAAVPIEISAERDHLRERTVPDYVLGRMERMLRQSEPSTEDGFDAVFDINEFQELRRAEVDRGGEKL